MAKISKHKYGWHPSVPDHRDLRYSVGPPTALPASVSLTPRLPPVFNQGQLGCCVDNSISSALQFDAMKNKQPDADMVRSRLFLYYNARVLEGTVESDSGSSVRDGIKSAATYGACNELVWPYDVAQFTVRPTNVCYQTAVSYKALVYYSVDQGLIAIKTCLAEGYPVIIGISVYESFESDEVAATGVVPMPSPGESLLGGHCVLMVGYDEARQQVECRNSWGRQWGVDGNFFLPYSYILNSRLACDFWTIRASG